MINVYLDRYVVQMLIKHLVQIAKLFYLYNVDCVKN